MRVAVVGLALVAGWRNPAAAACLVEGAVASVPEIVERLERERTRYVFIGEQHGAAAGKRFAVDLANALVDRGHDVGLYVEGFRTDCAPRDAECRSLARLFNAQAFLRLLDESRAPVHPLDPPEKDRRAARMAERIAGGGEAIRIVLVGNSHVRHAGDPAAELPAFGGGMKYPDPGDLVEAFPRAESLTIALSPAPPAAEEYSVRSGGCDADYSLSGAPTATY